VLCAHLLYPPAASHRPPREFQAHSSLPLTPPQRLALIDEKQELYGLWGKVSALPIPLLSYVLGQPAAQAQAERACD